MTAGGAERVVSILCNSLINKFKIYVITVVDTPSFYKLHPSITLLYCRREINPSKNVLDAIKSNYLIYKALLRILSEQKIELCIALMISSNIIATLAAKRLNIPIVICERNNPFLQNATTGSLWKILRRTYIPDGKYIDRTNQTRQKFL